MLVAEYWIRDCLMVDVDARWKREPDKGDRGTRRGGDFVTR